MASAPSTVSRSLASVWRTLRSMRTALILLLLVAVGSVAGSLVPQVANSPSRVASLYRDRPLLARVYEALGLFDVYGSWWFTLLYVLLLISLASCLLPRSRALLRTVRQRAQPLRDLGGMRHFAAGVVPEPPERALERARRVLRRRRYRVSVPDGTAGGLAAEKGAAREVGSLLFHWSFFLLLVGVAYGKGLGFTGVATVTEGETWTEAHASYDSPPREGRFFRTSMHTGFQLRVRDFGVSYRENGLPREFVSRVDVLDDGRQVGTEEIRVNDPLTFRGVKVYQSGYGWAPVIEVRQEGRLLASGPVVFVTDDPRDQRVPWRGVVKLPSLRPQVGIEMRLLPRQDGTGGVVPRGDRARRDRPVARRAGDLIPRAPAVHPVPGEAGSRNGDRPLVGRAPARSAPPRSVLQPAPRVGPGRSRSGRVSPRGGGVRPPAQGSVRGGVRRPRSGPRLSGDHRADC